MIDFLLNVFWQTWIIFKQASIFLLVGFLLAGVLAVVVPEKALSKLLGRGKVKSVLWASAIGAPLPLCSCGVVPAALGLRKQGATPGATAAFLIATPETGVDSISLSYALTDPLMTVFRPVTAVLTAITAGLGINLFPGRERSRQAETAAQVDLNDVECCAPVADESHEAHAPTPAHAHAHAHPHAHDEEAAQRAALTPAGALNASKRIYHYAFRQLLDDISYWIVLGIVLSAIVAAAVPPVFFERYLNNELASMLLMLVIGIPIYVCASEATPIAAAMVMKGLNPGAALVFLLAGPATNIGSLVVLSKFLGKRVMSIYLGSIVLVTLAAGYTLNWVYRAWEIDPQATFGKATAFLPEWAKVAAAVFLIALLVRSMWRTPVPVEWLWLRDKFAKLSGVRINAQRVAWGTAALLAVLYASSGFISVQPNEVGVHLRFGKIVAPELAPGLHYRLPWPFDSHRIIATQTVQRIEFGYSAPVQRLSMGSEGSDRITAAGWNNPTPQPIQVPKTWFQKDAGANESFFLTGDGTLINLKSALQYRVKNAQAYAYHVAEPELLLQSAVAAALRRTLATRYIDAIYTSARIEVEGQVMRTTQQILDQARSGMQVVAFRLHYVHPPDEVHDAFRDVASAQEDKLRTINRANMFAVESVNQAKAEAAAMLEQAQSFKEQQIRRAEGEAAGFGVRLQEYRRAPDLAKFRLQLEAIEETLPGTQKLIRPSAGEVKEFDFWLLQPVGLGKGK